MSARSPHRNEIMNGLVAAAAAAMEDDSQMKGEDLLDRKRKTGDGDVTGSIRIEASTSAMFNSASESNKRNKTIAISAAKSRRLEQNRRAAIESRRRKKVMVEELQRSVAFYTKANASLSLHNRELETKLILAKQRLHQIGAQASGNQVVDSLNLAEPKYEQDEDFKNVLDPLVLDKADVNVDPKVVIPDETAAAASDTLCEANEAKKNGSNVPRSSLCHTATTDMARSVVKSNASSANNFPLSFLSTSIPFCSSTTSKLLCPDAIANRLTVDETEDSYIESLKQFVAQQAAVASAAAASANAAMEAIKYHEMIRANGQTLTAQFPLSHFLGPFPPTSPVKKDCGQNEAP